LRATNFPKQPPTGASEDSMMLKDITKQNAILRRKLDDAN